MIYLSINLRTMYIYNRHKASTIYMMKKYSDQKPLKLKKVGLNQLLVFKLWWRCAHASILTHNLVFNTKFGL